MSCVELPDSSRLSSVSESSVITSKEEKVFPPPVKPTRRRNSVKSHRSKLNKLKPQAFNTLRLSIQLIREDVQVQVELANKFLEAMSKPLLPLKKFSAFM
jgi:hypothetical protein